MSREQFISGDEYPDPKIGADIPAATINAYKRVFLEQTARAGTARNHAYKALEHLHSVLQSRGMHPAQLTGEFYMDQGRLQRVLAWAAFDYSVPTDATSFDIVDPIVLTSPLLAGLDQTGLNFPSVTLGLEITVVAMQAYRERSGLGPVASNPSNEFNLDLEAVGGLILPGQ